MDDQQRTPVVAEGNRVILAGRELPADYWGDPIHDAPTEYRKTATVLARQLDYAAVVRTPEGDMTLEPGDYLVTDNPATHAWPVRREVFEATYVPAGRTSYVDSSAGIDVTRTRRA